MAGLSASFAYDDLMLDQRGELVTALVLRTNYDQRGRTFNAELRAPFAGVPVLVEDIHQRPVAVELIDLEVDPRHPTRVRDPQSWRWNPIDVAFIALTPTVHSSPGPASTTSADAEALDVCALIRLRHHPVPSATS